MFYRLKTKIWQWLNQPVPPSYMIYLGRNVPVGSSLDFDYVNDEMLSVFLNEQPYFDSFTIWEARGA